ncbi:MAG: hypothetical protein AABY32_03975 [Nanoarchaeota archaeon]|mgnify:CR=1 FL=1
MVTKDYSFISIVLSIMAFGILGLFSVLEFRQKDNKIKELKQEAVLRNVGEFYTDGEEINFRWIVEPKPEKQK